jgi:hypothetical protein
MKGQKNVRMVVGNCFNVKERRRKGEKNDRQDKYRGWESNNGERRV